MLIAVEARDAHLPIGHSDVLLVNTSYSISQGSRCILATPQEHLELFLFWSSFPRKGLLGPETNILKAIMMILQLIFGIVTVLASTDQVDHANPSLPPPDEEDEGVSLLQYKMHVLPRKFADDATSGAWSDGASSSREGTFDAVYEGLLTLLAFICTTCVGGAIGRLREVEFNTLPQVLQIVCGRRHRAEHVE